MGNSTESNSGSSDANKDGNKEAEGEQLGGKVGGVEKEKQVTSNVNSLKQEKKESAVDGGPKGEESQGKIKEETKVKFIKSWFKRNLNS